MDVSSRAGAAQPGIPGPRPARRPRSASAGDGTAPPDAAAASRVAGLVPVPVHVHPADGTFTLSADTVIATDPPATEVGTYLADLLRPATGHPLPVVPAVPTPRGRAASPPPNGEIRLLLAGAHAGVGTEGYQLDVTAAEVVIRARTTTGLFHGVQTLRQLLPPQLEGGTPHPGPWLVPAGQIIDYPRFRYRGAMLDVARHFFPVADVQRYLDELAYYKINHLHLHLTDDQGWRIAIDSWPRLATVGGAGEVDGGPGGYYTKEQYRQIVAHAAARHITVVPEIDLPGHTNAALTAYGTLAPDGVTPPPYTGTDVGFSALAVNRDLTYGFIADVVGEVAALTPGPYLHIGGDEAWTLGRADYTAFMNRVQPIVAATGKTVVGWHQLAVADQLPGRVLQFWGTTPNEAAVAEAVRHGAKVILSPGNRTYLDMKYTPETPLGKDWAGPVEVREAYDWDPGSYLAGVPTEAVLGVEAPLWTETIATLDQIEFMTFPRLPAVAELGWSPGSTHDWESFRQRLARHGPRWVAAGIAFHPSPEIPWPQHESAPLVTAPAGPAGGDPCPIHPRPAARPGLTGEPASSGAGLTPA